MAIGMRQKRKGMFDAFEMPNPQGTDIMQQQPAYGAGMGEQKKAGLGTRLLGEGWEDKAAALGSMLMGNSNAIGDYHYGQQQQQAQAQQAQQQAAAAQAARAQGLADWRYKEDYKRENAAPANNDTVNDYNFWKENLPPDQFNQWLQNNHINPTFYTGPDGRRYPNPTSAPTAPVGKLRPVGSATIQNTPAPRTGSNGMPAQLSRKQYEATVQAMGKAETDAWMRRHNIGMTN